MASATLSIAAWVRWQATRHRPVRLCVSVDVIDDCHPEALGDLNAAIDRNTGRVPIAQTLARLDRHPTEIVKRLRRGGRTAGSKQRLDRPGADK